MNYFSSWNRFTLLFVPGYVTYYFNIGVVRCYFEASLHLLMCEGELAWASEKIIRLLEIFHHPFMYAMKCSVKYNLTWIHKVTFSAVNMQFSFSLFFFFLVHFHFCLSMLYSYSYAIQNKNTINAQSNEKNQLVSRAKKYTYDPKIWDLVVWKAVPGRTGDVYPGITPQKMGKDIIWIFIYQ